MQRFPVTVAFSGTDRHDVSYDGDLVQLIPDAGGRKLTGMVGYGLGYEEAEFVVSGGNSVTIAHNNANSAAENRFYMGDGLDRVLTPGISWYATYFPAGLVTALGNFGPGWYGAEALV